MKFSDVAFLKPGRILPTEYKAVPASTDLLALSDVEFAGLPDNVVVVDGNSTAVIDKGLLGYLRTACLSEYIIGMLENAPMGVVAIDEDGRIFYANAAYSSILGIPKQLVLGRSMRDIEPDAAILDVLQGREALINRTVWVASVKRHVRVNIAPLRRGGRPWGAVSFFTDVTGTTRLAGELSKVKGLADHFQKELESQRQLPKSFTDIIGRNPQFLRVLQTASIVADTEASLLIQGENGVGKEVLARAVHRASPRHGRPFITVNCAAVPEALMESELFGYEEGAFTGARKGGRLGKFELAEGGVLFLDEIGDMPTSMQAKLLRALQEKEIEKIGRSRTIAVDVRIIAATNHNLEEMVRDGRFRTDLFYRLNVVSLTIPPLRERMDDIIPLAEDILEQCSRKYRKDIVLSPRLHHVLCGHSWPGNVRELANTLEYAVIMCAGPQLLPEHLPTSFFGNEKRPALATIPMTGNWREVMRHMEKALLQKALEECGDNRSEAIRRLGLSRKAFYEKLKQHGLFLRRT